MNLFKSLKYKINCRLRSYYHHKEQKKVKSAILKYYSIHPTDDQEINNAISYLREYPLNTFPDKFILSYSPKEIRVYKDLSNGLHYVLHQNKKLYFKRSYNINTVKLCYCGLLSEQDKQSPHCYTDEQFGIQHDDILLDIGCAEGILSLTYIERLKKVILFEQDMEWIEALKATFAPWKDKISIVNKYVSDKNDKDNIAIDTFLSDKDYKPDFIKIDVEGAEQQVLNGMNHLTSENHLKIALCSYHHQEDYDAFNPYLKKYGFTCAPSKGVMIFTNDLKQIVPPYFRKGVIRAYK